MQKRKTYAITVLKVEDAPGHLGNRGNAFIEYFILALIVLGATIWFFNGGSFQGVRENVDTSFTTLINKVAQ